MSKARDPWPSFRKRAQRVLAEVVTHEVAAELAVMLAEVGARLCVTGEHPEGSQAAGQWFMPVALPEERADPEDMTLGEKRIIARIFRDGEGCRHCGSYHLRACPRVRRMVFQGDEIREVEFFRHGEWPTESLLHPEDFPVSLLDEDDPA